MEQISRKGIYGTRNSAGVGNIIIIVDGGITRENFIANCYRTGMVSVLSNSWRLDNVKITKAALDEIVFPKLPNELGSQVVYVNIPKQNQPVVIGVLSKNNEFIDISENDFSLKRVSDTGFVEIKGKGKDGNLYINVETTSAEGGNMIISLNGRGGSKSGILNINTDNEVRLSAENKVSISSAEELNFKISNPEKSKNFTEIKYKREEGFSYIDEFGNEIQIVDGEVSIKSTKIKVGNGDYSLSNLLKDIISEVSNITTTTAIGTQPPINIAQLKLLSKKVDKILT